MSTEDRTLLTLASELHRPLARAAKLGRGNGAAYAVFGLLSLMFAVMPVDGVGLGIGAVLLGVGFFERWQCRRLLHADAAAPKRLALAELTLLAAIVIYGVLGLTVLPSAGDLLNEQLGGTQGLGIDVQGLAESMNQVWYATVIGVALLYQGGMALYFHRRSAVLARYVQAVPAWARELVESMAN